VKLKGGFAPIIILIIVIFVVGTGITVGYPHIKGLVENKLQTDLSATPSGSPESEDLPNTSGPNPPHQHQKLQALQTTLVLFPP